MMDGQWFTSVDILVYHCMKLLPVSNYGLNQMLDVGIITRNAFRFILQGFRKGIHSILANQLLSRPCRELAFVVFRQCLRKSCFALKEFSGNAREAWICEFFNV